MNLAFKPYAVKALKGADSELTGLFKSDAINANWPKQLVSKIKLSFIDATIVVGYPDEFTALIDDLEYGGPNNPPQPVFRLFEAKHGDVITRKIAETSLSYLESEGAIP